jgi:hypothetical protein
MEEGMTTTLAIRTATDRDLPFIKSGWLDSYRDGRTVRGVPNSIYYRMQDKVVSHILRRALCVVACNEDNPDELFGFLCCEIAEGLPVVHYVYVRSGSRRAGVAHRLLTAFLSQEQDPTICVYTHDTPAFYPVLRGRTKDYLGVGWVYDPFLIWRVIPSGWAGSL